VTGVTPSIAVVIPAYRQPRLLAEALYSLEQSTSWPDVVPVIVNDGCPYPETRDISLMWQRNYPRKVFYLEVPNGGLSAARNLGIDFVLDAVPTARFIYFLDADNRVGTSTISKLREALDASAPDVGWAYADLEKFGVKELAANGGEYRPVEHLQINICDAGSLIRRSLVETGLRFDVDIPGGGYEDWLFWLEAVDAGYRGVHVPFAGFAYRKRPHSMVADANQTRGEKLRYFGSKLAGLYGRTNINWLDSQQNNILAVFGADLRGVYVGTGRSVGKEQWLSELLRSEVDTGCVGSPRYILSVPRANMTDNPELANLAWQLRVMLAEGERAHWACLTSSEVAGSTLVGSTRLVSALRNADAWMASVGTIASYCIRRAPQQYRVRYRRPLHGEGASSAANTEVAVMSAISDAFHSEPIAAFDAILPNSHRRGGRARRPSAIELLDHGSSVELLDRGELYPVYPISEGQRLVAVLASSASPVAHVLATCSQLAEHSGIRAAVFATDPGVARELTLLGLEVYSLEYVLTAPMRDDERRRWLGNTLLRFEEIIDHASDRTTFGAYGDLKNAGVRLITHVADSTDLVSAVLNESSITRYVVTSERTKDRLLALGVPEAKVSLANG
jgi:glycosyltransferase involved in cell wall biosynthesis